MYFFHTWLEYFGYQLHFSLYLFQYLFLFLVMTWCMCIKILKPLLTKPRRVISTMYWGPKITTDWNTGDEATKLSVLSLVVIATLHAATVVAPPRCLSKSQKRCFSVNRKFWMPSLLGKHASLQNKINGIWFSVISLSI